MTSIVQVGIFSLLATMLTSIVQGWTMFVQTQTANLTNYRLCSIVDKTTGSVVRKSHRNQIIASNGMNEFRDIGDAGARAGARVSSLTEIDIDDVILEASNALKVAEKSLENDNDNNDENENYDNNSISSSSNKENSSKIFTAILSSTIGGSLIGCIMGSIFAFDKISYYDGTVEMSVIHLAVPILVGITLGAIVGFVCGMQDSPVGEAVRTILGTPIQALASAIIEYIQFAIARQVEKTTSDVKAIPSKLAISAREKAEQTANDVKSKVIFTLKTTAEKTQQVLLFLVTTTTIILFGIYLLNQ